MKERASSQQEKANQQSPPESTPIQRNGTSQQPPQSGISAADNGLLENLRTKIEQQADVDMSDVRVHYNSSKPAQVNAAAFAQGANIFVAPGQEKHLPHEAWHVAQQKQGRVPATGAVNGVPLNDDPSLEQEADSMGRQGVMQQTTSMNADAPQGDHATIQRVTEITKKLNEMPSVEAIEQVFQDQMDEQDLMDQYRPHVLEMLARDLALMDWKNSDMTLNDLYTEYMGALEQSQEMENYLDDEEDDDYTDDEAYDISSFVKPKGLVNKGKQLIKDVKHFGSDKKVSMKQKLGMKQAYKVVSSSSDQQSLLASVAPNVQISQDKSLAQKGGKFVADKVLGNFIKAVTAGRRVSKVGKQKKQVQQGDLASGEQELRDMLRIVNSLKGAFKRQFVWETTVGTLKQALKRTLDVATGGGSTGVTDLIGAPLEEIGQFGLEKVGHKVGDLAMKHGQKKPKGLFVGGGDKLDEDEWAYMINKYLNHEDPRVSAWMEGVISSISLSNQKGVALVQIAYGSPGEAAKLIYARQQGKEEFDKQVKIYEKAHKKKN